MNDLPNFQKDQSKEQEMDVEGAKTRTESAKPELLEIDDNTYVAELLDITGKELNKDLSTYKELFKQNWVTTVEDLRQSTPDSWNRWNLSPKLADTLRLKIHSEEKSFLIDPSPHDAVDYVVDMSYLPLCGSFNPYGNEQMAKRVNKKKVQQVQEDPITFQDFLSYDHIQEVIFPLLSDLELNLLCCVSEFFEHTIKLYRKEFPAIIRGDIVSVDWKRIVKILDQGCSSLAVLCSAVAISDGDTISPEFKNLFPVFQNPFTSGKFWQNIRSQSKQDKKRSGDELSSKDTKRLKGREPAEDFQSLIQTLNDLVPTSEIKPSKPEFDYIEDANTNSEFITYVSMNYEAFKQDIGTRSAHPFIILATASGMGKSRFGTEASKIASSCLDQDKIPIISIMIDFNGGGDKLDAKLDVDPNISLGLRLLAKGYFKCETEVLRRYILPEEEKYCIFSDVAILIGNQLRHDTSLPICLLLHLDEFQLAHEFMKEKNNPDFLKNMIYAIGEFKVRSSTRSFSYAKENNIFLIPLLTGTTRDGTALAITRYHAKYLSLDPINPAAALKILMTKFQQDVQDQVIPSPLLELLKSKAFLTLLGDIGVVPKYLLWLYLAIKGDKKSTKILIQQTNVEKKVFQFAAFLKQQVSMSSLLEKLSNNKKELFRFLSDCVYHSEVTWTTQYNGFTIETLAKDGNIFIKSISLSSLSLFFPCMLLNSFLQGLEGFKFKELETLTSFPFDNSWQRFEEIIMTFVLIRFKISALSGNGVVLFQSLFQRYLGMKDDYRLKVKEGELHRDNAKWIYTSKNNLIFNQVSMSEGTYLCLDGNKYFDGRVCCKTEDGKKVLIAIQTRKTDCEKMSMITYEELKKGRDSLLVQYKNDFEIIIVGGITNSPLSEPEKKKFNNVKNVFCISQTELNSFTLSLSHRFK